MLIIYERVISSFSFLFRYGPDAPEILQKLLELNECLGKIMDILERLRLWPNEMDILVVSYGTLLLIITTNN